MQTKNAIPLYSLLAANMISRVGNVFSSLAIPWFVLQATGSAAWTGATAFAAILPVVLAGFLGGALIDRMGYKRVSIVSDLASGVTTALIPLLFYTVGLDYWQILVLVFLGALLDAPGGTARSALLPDLAKQADMPIERATSLISLIERVAGLVGAPLAGLLIAMIGMENVLWLDAVSFFISAGMVALAVASPPRKEDKKEEQSSGDYFGEMRAGWRFVAYDALILAVVIVVLLTNLLDSVFWGVIRPVYVKAVFGDALDLGLLIAANSAGAILGGVLFAWIGHRLPRHAAFVGAFLLVGLHYWSYYLQLPFYALVIASFFTSIGAGPINPIIDAVLFERIPETMRGRVLGAVTAGAWVAMPLGLLAGGVLVDSSGVFPILFGVSIAYLLTTISMAIIPAMKEMNRKPADGVLGETN